MLFHLFCINGRRSLHLRIHELTLDQTSSTSKPYIATFKVEDQFLEDFVEENPNQNQNTLENWTNQQFLSNNGRNSTPKQGGTIYMWDI